MEWLRQAGFPAPAIVPTISSETFLVLDDEFYEIHEYIESEPYDPERPAHLEEAAVTLGRYHTYVQGFSPQALCNLGALYSPTILSTTLTDLGDTWELDRNPDLAQTSINSWLNTLPMPRWAGDVWSSRLRRVWAICGSWTRWLRQPEKATLWR